MSGQSQKFEASMERLEEIVKKLERGDAALDEALKLFEEGTKLAAACTKQLDAAELKVTKLVKTADGTPREEKFDDAQPI